MDQDTQKTILQQEWSGGRFREMYRDKRLFKRGFLNSLRCSSLWFYSWGQVASLFQGSSIKISFCLWWYFVLGFFTCNQKARFCHSYWKAGLPCFMSAVCWDPFMYLLRIKFSRTAGQQMSEYCLFQSSLRCHKNGTCSNMAESCLETTRPGCNSVLWSPFCLLPVARDYWGQIIMGFTELQLPNYLLWCFYSYQLSPFSLESSTHPSIFAPLISI